MKARFISRRKGTHICRNLQHFGGNFEAAQQERGPRACGPLSCFPQWDTPLRFGDCRVSKRVVDLHKADGLDLR